MEGGAAAAGVVSPGERQRWRWRKYACVHIVATSKCVQRIAIQVLRRALLCSGVDCQRDKVCDDQCWNSHRRAPTRSVTHIKIREGSCAIRTLRHRPIWPSLVPMTLDTTARTRPFESLTLTVVLD